VGEAGEQTDCVFHGEDSTNRIVQTSKLDIACFDSCDDSGDEVLVFEGHHHHVNPGAETLHDTEIRVRVELTESEPVGDHETFEPQLALQYLGEESVMTVDLLAVPRTVGGHDRQRARRNRRMERIQVHRSKSFLVDPGVALVDFPAVTPVVPEIQPLHRTCRSPGGAAITDEVFDARKCGAGAVAGLADDTPDSGGAEP